MELYLFTREPLDAVKKACSAYKTEHPDHFAQRQNFLIVAEPGSRNPNEVVNYPTRVCINGTAEESIQFLQYFRECIDKNPILFDGSGKRTLDDVINENT